MRRKFFLRGGAALAAGLVAARARAESEFRVVQSRPSADAMLAPQDRRFFVRFSQPVDHLRSRLIIRQGDKLIAVLEPRLEAEPEVLFAATPELKPGHYRFAWQVISLEGQRIAEGGVDFTIMG